MTKKLTVFQFHFKTIIDTLNSGRYMDSLNDATYIDQLLAKKRIFIKFRSSEYESWIPFFSRTSGTKATQTRRIYMPPHETHLHP